MEIKDRKSILIKLLKNIQFYENEVIEALYKDFKKPKFEAIITETSYVISDLKNTIKNIEKWSKPKRVFPSILNFPSSNYIYNEPYGKVLIISPWNYPFQLTFCPLIAAVATGNSVTIKPSEHAVNTAIIVSKIIRETFNNKQVVCVLGNADLAKNLLEKRWDYIFFTGSVAVGKIVAAQAAKFLTPTTLELGGKSPCIVDQNIDLQLAAKRIVWGKFLNAGQICIAPDYLLVHESIKNIFIKNLILEIEKAYTNNIENSKDYTRIINQNHLKRLLNLIVNQNVIYGGVFNEIDNYLAPTLVDNPSLDSSLMQEEIFGPILPILTFKNESDLKKIILCYEKPLALYVFSNNNDFSENIIKKIPFGGGCVNDTIIHFGNKRLPFGGVGHSGIGAYHGKRSFDTFSHQKSIVKKANWLDILLRYAPYGKKINWLNKILNWI